MIDDKRKSLSRSQLVCKHKYQAFSNSFLLTGFGSPIQEDLPNVFGINPIEGTIIFGILYYIYGPGTLYEYAREAGKFVSTYGPIVKEVSFDIFYEFRDYLEEERQRDVLRKSGVDVDAMPRKTTNVIERFQESLKAFSDATTNNEDSKVLKSAFSNDDEDMTNDINNESDNNLEYKLNIKKSKVINNKRKSKKEVLSDRNVDIDEVKLATNNILSGTTSLITDIDKESLNTISTKINSLKSSNEEQKSMVTDSYLIDSKVNLYNQESTESFYTFPQLSDMIANDEAVVPMKQNNLEQSLSLNKFQQQMSGQWNQRVLRRDKYKTPSAANNELYDDGYGDLPLPNDFNELTSIDMYNENDEFLRNSDFNEKQIINNNVPSDLSILDMNATASIDNFSIELSNTPLSESLEGLSVLRELDKDYLVLRSKFLKYLEQQQNQLDQMKQKTLNLDFVDNNRNSTDINEVNHDSNLISSQIKSSTVPNKRKYWPPVTAYQKKSK